VEELPDRLRALRDRPEASALLTDFDGTLAPIVTDPETARPVPGALEVLAGLARRLALVAVVSGRPAAFLYEVLGPLPNVRLFGLYGMEEVSSDGVVQIAGDAAAWRDVVAGVTSRAQAGAPAGIQVEPKGLAVALIWRARPEAESWVREFCRREAASGLVIQPGRMSVELRPPVGSDKGTVVRDLAPGHEVAAYFGDDVGDLPAFEALDELGAKGMTVAKVAVVSDETPAAIAAAATVTIEGPRAAVAVLRQLLGPAVPS
jgi:trehalose 6-phosphate phosphatase